MNANRSGAWGPGGWRKSEEPAPAPICADSANGLHDLHVQGGGQWQWIKCLCCARTFAYWPRDYAPSDVTLEKG